MLSGKGLMMSVQVCVVFGLTVLKVLGKFSLTTSIVALENTANPVQPTGAAGTEQEEGDEVRESHGIEDNEEGDKGVYYGGSDDGNETGRQSPELF